MESSFKLLNYEDAAEQERTLSLLRWQTRTCSLPGRREDVHTSLLR